MWHGRSHRRRSRLSLRACDASADTHKGTFQFSAVIAPFEVPRLNTIFTTRHSRLSLPPSIELLVVYKQSTTALSSRYPPAKGPSLGALSVAPSPAPRSSLWAAGTTSNLSEKTDQAPECQMITRGLRTYLDIATNGSISLVYLPPSRRFGSSC